MRCTPGPRRLAVAAVLTLLLAACGGDEEPATTGAPTSESSSETSAEGGSDSGEAEVVEVTETEFAIELSEDSFSPGDYRFVIANGGEFPHNLAIMGPGVDSEISDTFEPSQSGELEVTLEEGSYTLWCGVGNHRSQGMETTIEVTA